MERRTDFKPEKGTFDSAWGVVSYTVYKNGQIRWSVADRKGKAHLTKPGDDVNAAVAAALINLPGSQPAAAAPEASLVAEGDAPR
jgi:hypothetical protein